MAESEYNQLLKDLDRRDMAGFVRSFVNDLETALSTETGLVNDADWSGVLCLGMGGSGAGGLFLSALSNESGGLPIVAWRDYGVPSWWGSDWLVFATSYSGNTEETLEGVRYVLENGGTVVGICSGGELEEIISSSEDSVCLKVPPGQMPRSAFGHIFGTQLAACWALGILPSSSEEEISSMLKRLRKSSEENDLSNKDGLAARLSRSLVGKEIGILAPSILGPAAYRFSCQLNENSAKFARSAEIPEMNHNEIIAWTSSESSEQALIVLTCDNLHSRTSARIDWLLEEIDSSEKWDVHCEGHSFLESLLFAAHITDWVSIGLAVLTGEDPSDMPAIDSLKEHLSTII